MRNAFYILVTAIGVLAPPTWAADETNGSFSSSLNYGSFQIITDRNIFNQSRSGGRSRNYTRTRSERRPRTDAFTLRGTMSYEKGLFAFFDGTSSDYRKAVQPVDTIAGFKVLSVSPESVKLEANGKQVDLQVGMQMKRPEGGDWQLADAGETFDASSSSSGTGDTNTTPANTTETVASTGGESDALKRLMQKREQELNADAGKGEPKKE